MSSSRDIFEGFLKILDTGGWFALLGIIGGIGRLVLGVKPNDSLFREIIRILFIAAPVGWLIAGLVTEWKHLEGYSFLAFSAAFLGGMMALNIARALQELGIKEVLAIVFNLRGYVKDSDKGGSGK